MVKILLTRPKRISENTAKYLSKKNISSLIQPLFSVIKINNLKLKNVHLQAVLITSSNAIFALKKLSIKTDTLILAVGPKTGTKVKKLGYKNILFANNSAASLLDLATKTLINNDNLVLYLCGKIITLDLARKLSDLGFTTRKIVTYKTIERRKFSQKTIDGIRSGSISEVWLYSKNSEIIFYKLAKQHNLLEYLKQIKILYLGTEIIAPHSN